MLLSPMLISLPLVRFQVRADGDRPCHRPRRRPVASPLIWPSRQQRRQRRRLIVLQQPKGRSSGRSRRPASDTPTACRSSTTKRKKTRIGLVSTDFAPQMAEPSRPPPDVACRPFELSARITGGLPVWITLSMASETDPRPQSTEEVVAIVSDRPITNRSLLRASRCVPGRRAGVPSAS